MAPTAHERASHAGLFRCVVVMITTMMSDISERRCYINLIEMFLEHLRHGSPICDSITMSDTSRASSLCFAVVLLGSLIHIRSIWAVARARICGRCVLRYDLHLFGILSGKSTTSSADAEGPRDAVQIRNSALEKACDSGMTFKDTQGHYNCCY